MLMYRLIMAWKRRQDSPGASSSSGSPPAGHRNREHGDPDGKGADERKNRESRRGDCLRGNAIEHAFGTERQFGQNAAVGIDNRGNSAVRGADQGQSFLDRTQPRLREMLVRASARPKPSVVRYVEKQSRTRRPGGHNLARKDRLVANQRRDGRQSRHNQ